MPTSHAKQCAFAVWITGLPASGKSTLARELVRQLQGWNVSPVVLESDVLRRTFLPEAGYEQGDRDRFYEKMRSLGIDLTRRGVPVIFDATANLRRYRDDTRRMIPQFLEVYVSSSLEACMARDPKGIYRSALENPSGNVPGVQAPYEEPATPEVTISGETDPPDLAARRVITALVKRGYLRRPRKGTRIN